MQTIKPIIRRAGSKWRLAPKLIKLFPPHKTYCEVFAGTSGVLIRKIPSKFEIINDIDSNLTNLFMVLQNENLFEKFMQQVQFMHNNEEMFKNYKEVLSTTEDSLEKATAFYYLTFFGSSGSKGEPYFQLTKKHHRTLRWVDENNLFFFKERMKKVQVINHCFRKVIPEIDSPETFFYCDPPYYEIGNKLYAFPFEQQDHENLSSLLKEIKGKFLLSYNVLPEIEELYEWANIEKILVHYSNSPGATKKKYEFLISNSRPRPTVLDEFITQEAI